MITKNIRGGDWQGNCHVSIQSLANNQGNCAVQLVARAGNLAAISHRHWSGNPGDEISRLALKRTGTIREIISKKVFNAMDPNVWTNPV